MHAPSTLSDRTSRGSRGFTLLEVMVALAIIGIALVTLLSLANRSISLGGKLQKVTQATLLAQEKMTEVELGAQSGGAAEQVGEGVFSEPFGIYRWRVGLSDTPLASVAQVTVTVAWGNEAKNEAVAIDSFVFR